MKKYVYRFESLLNIRELQKEEAEREFREAAMALEREISVLEDLKGKIGQLLIDMLKIMEETFDINMLRVCNDYYKSLNEQIERQLVVITQAEELMEQRREELVEAMKEKEIFVNLKDKDFEEYKMELKRWEQEVMDDLSTMRQEHSNALSAGNAGFGV